MANLPTIALLGAPGTGAMALALDLEQHIGPTSALIICATAPEDCAEAALTLLMGLDQPCSAQEQTARETADTRLRAALAHAGVGYRVVYGLGAQRTRNALIAIKTIAVNAYGVSGKAVFDAKTITHNPRLRSASCEKCSDPDCERRLFTSLVGQRETAPP